MQGSRSIPKWCITTLMLALCLAPLMMMGVQLSSGDLGPDPAKRLMQGTGEWGLRGLALVLLAAPLAKSGWRGLFQYRRMLGVSVFGYVSLHLILFSQVYVGWSVSLLVEELQERPYVLVGFSAWCALLPLALTSTDRARRRLAGAGGNFTVSSTLPPCSPGFIFSGWLVLMWVRRWFMV